MEYSSDSVNELDYPCDYSLQEDMSGSEDGNGCCLHVPPIPETPEQIRSKVRRITALKYSYNSKATNY